MAGLNSLISDTTTQATTLPSWMSTAQQNVVNQAAASAANVPTLQNTVAQGAINQLNSSANPFSTAQGTLGTIASGAANPWITDPTTGQVTPNTGTALGGLFAAQNQQLQTLIPQITSPADAASIASGNFGSLRNETAADTALTNAQANLAASQMQAALNNQQTGVQAASAQGDVANQYGTTANTLAGLQQTAPLSTAANVGKIISSLGVPTTETNSAQLSPLTQITSLAGALGGGTNAVNSLLNTVSPGTSIASLLGNLFTNSGSGMTQSGSALGGGVTPGTFPLANGGTITVNPDGSQTISNPGQAPQYFNADGSVASGTSTSAAVSPTPDLSGQYSGAASTPTSTGGSSSQDIVNAAASQGYTYDPYLD
jgi:hypothetical protein